MTTPSTAARAAVACLGLLVLVPIGAGLTATLGDDGTVYLAGAPGEAFTVSLRPADDCATAPGESAIIFAGALDGNGTATLPAPDFSNWTAAALNVTVEPDGAWFCWPSPIPLLDGGDEIEPEGSLADAPLLLLGAPAAPGRTATDHLWDDAFDCIGTVGPTRVHGFPTGTWHFQPAGGGTIWRVDCPLGSPLRTLELRQSTAFWTGGAFTVSAGRDDLGAGYTPVGLEIALTLDRAVSPTIRLDLVLPRSLLPTDDTTLVFLERDGDGWREVPWTQTPLPGGQFGMRVSPSTTGVYALALRSPAPPLAAEDAPVDQPSSFGAPEVQKALGSFLLVFALVGVAVWVKRRN